MLGAISGDIIGSIYERQNIKNKDFVLFSKINKFTDDTVMTCAIANACMEYQDKKNKEHFKERCIFNMQKLGRDYINAGYGGNFIYWLLDNNPKPYNSYGNGSAMRVSPVGYIANSLVEAEELAKLSAEVSHNHIEGIKGAQVISGMIFLALHGSSKEQLYDYAKKSYNLDFTLDEIREDYSFDVSCQGSVPQAINAFLESENFEDTIRNSISIGGDSDTIAAISGSIAEAYYGIPKKIAEKSISYLTPDLLNIVKQFYEKIKSKKDTYDEKKIPKL